MPDALSEPLEVATCIGCGARSRPGECRDGCEDVPIDLVDAVGLDSLANALGALERRLAALRKVAEALVGEHGGAWPALRREARDALRANPAPDAVEDVELIQAWGCPSCGRIDAPQPCLGVCIRRPAFVVDARRLDEVTDAIAAARARGALDPTGRAVP